MLHLLNVTKILGFGGYTVQQVERKASRPGRTILQIRQGSLFGEPLRGIV